MTQISVWCRCQPASRKARAKKLRVRPGGMGDIQGRVGLKRRIRRPEAGFEQVTEPIGPVVCQGQALSRTALVVDAVGRVGPQPAGLSAGHQLVDVGGISCIAAQQAVLPELPEVAGLGHSPVVEVGDVVRLGRPREGLIEG